jgi:signal transduction histidine kinase
MEIIVVGFLIFYLRKFLRDNKLYPEWDRKLSALLVLSVIVFFIQVSVPGARVAAMWLGFGAFAGLAWLIFTKKELIPLKPVINMVLPYAAIAFFGEAIKLASITWYDKCSGYISMGKTFAVIWMFAMWFINNRQRKALELEKKKNAEKEREIRITASIKAELEVQVAQRTAALTQQKEELQHALDELKNTQNQLIQAEKMASLGELTAGIAHEIQNPLNFVTNFSEVTNELIDEMTAEMAAGNNEEVVAIAADIKQNLEKINHHGKRADAIVKGMLQHSRKNTGQRELTDINALADEYLRLAYHGLRAKDNTFNAAMHTDFDKTIGKLNIVPQDMGRVLLNLFSNAFYAVTDKRKSAGTDYKPAVTITTRKENGKVLITVADNGNGVPRAIIDKIFQPFFTTKPTGQGTGLGLSLSYDIVTAHGGEIKAETKEGEGTEFIIQLPAA